MEKEPTVYPFICPLLLIIETTADLADCPPLELIGVTLRQFFSVL